MDATLLPLVLAVLDAGAFTVFSPRRATFGFLARVAGSEAFGSIRMGS